MNMSSDIQELADRYFADPTPARREDLIIASAALVHAVVNRLHVPKHACISHEDLIGVGLLGLMEALDRFDPEVGSRFTTFAYLRIRGATIDYLRLIDVLARDRRREVAGVRKVTEELAQQYGEQPPDEEIAAFLGISLDKYYDVVQDARGRNTMYLHEFVSADHGTEWIDLLEDREAVENVEQIERDSTGDHLRTLMNALPERDRQVLHFYYFEQLTQREIGERLHVSEARISQVMSRALCRLRDHCSTPAFAA
jgi:RNA polymerase sigma factor FliA